MTDRTIQFHETPAEASVWCHEMRHLGHSVGYVPTMGALHEGHLSLVQRSILENDVTCVSIFVNPLQFNNPEDLAKYPQTLDDDLRMLDEAGCDMAYTGSLDTFFPEVDDVTCMPTVVPLPAIRGLEAEFRPGHLEGVQAIVERLFQTVGACKAYFGEKDFQQTLLVRQIATTLDIGVEVVVCPTVRESSGLAMSSRNRRLAGEDRNLAMALSRSLYAAAKAWQQGERNPDVLEGLMREILDHPGITVEYAAIRDPENWTVNTPQGALTQARGLVAAWIGGVRLIDNMDLAAA